MQWATPVVLNAGDLVRRGLHRAVGAARRDHARRHPQLVDTAIVGPGNPADLRRLIGGGTRVAGRVEVAPDVCAFMPDLYSGALTATRRAAVRMRIVTLDQPR